MSSSDQRQLVRTVPLAAKADTAERARRQCGLAACSGTLHSIAQHPDSTPTDCSSLPRQRVLTAQQLSYEACAQEPGVVRCSGAC